MALQQRGGGQVDSRAGRETVTGVVGCLDILVVRGVLEVMREDERFRGFAGAPGPAELERAVAERRPDAIVGEAAAHSVLMRLKERNPGLGLLVLARDPTPPYGTVLLSVRLTCLAASASTTELLEAVHLVAQGDHVFLSADGQRVRSPSRERLRSLTKREHQVLGHLVKGRSEPEIAVRLHISIETARTHRRSVFRKLNIKSRRELLGMTPTGGEGI